MTLKRIIPNLLTTVLLVTGPVFMLCAQEDTAAKQIDTSYNFFGPSGYSDEVFISKNIEDNTKEIELAKLAIDKSSNDSIKSVAKDIIEHHSKLLEDLKQLRVVSGEEQDAVSDEEVVTEENQEQEDVVTEENKEQEDVVNKEEEDVVNNEQEDVATQENNMQSDSAAVDNQPANANPYDPAAMLVNAAPEQFDSMWVRQMLIDHKIKLGELHQARKTTDDPKIKSLVKEAIPMVRNMRDKLESINAPQYTSMIWKKE